MHINVYYTCTHTSVMHASIRLFTHMKYIIHTGWEQQCVLNKNKLSYTVSSTANVMIIAQTVRLAHRYMIYVRNLRAFIMHVSLQTLTAAIQTYIHTYIHTYTYTYIHVLNRYDYLMPTYWEGKQVCMHVFFTHMHAYVSMPRPSGLQTFIVATSREYVRMACSWECQPMRPNCEHLHMTRGLALAQGIENEHASTYCEVVNVCCGSECPLTHVRRANLWYISCLRLCCQKKSGVDRFLRSQPFELPWFLSQTPYSNVAIPWVPTFSGNSNADSFMYVTGTRTQVTCGWHFMTSYMHHLHATDVTKTYE
jgi:hypothetical protein